MDTFFDQKNKERMGKLLLLLVLFAALYMCMKFVNEVKTAGAGNGDVTTASTIDVTGTGTAFAIPDVANESFTVEQKSATVHDAQTIVTKKANDAIAFLKSSGIAEKDIQTTSYSASPQYDYSTYGTQRLTGYDVTETITVKIRDTSTVGAIVDGLGSKGVTGLSGPDFTVDDPASVNAEARAKAIDDAETKAKILARDLGVHLVRIVRFSESTGGSYPPIMYSQAKDMAMGAAAPAPELPAGQNKYTSNVTVTYEIR